MIPKWVADLYARHPAVFELVRDAVVRGAGGVVSIHFGDDGAPMKGELKSVGSRVPCTDPAAMQTLRRLLPNGRGGVTFHFRDDSAVGFETTETRRFR